MTAKQMGATRRVDDGLARAHSIYQTEGKSNAADFARKQARRRDARRAERRLTRLNPTRAVDLNAASGPAAIRHAMIFQKGYADMSKAGLLSRVAMVFAKGASACAANTALIVGLAVAPVVGTIGATMDFSEANMVQTRLQKAAEGAALALGSEAGLPDTTRDMLARAEVAARVGDAARLLGLHVASAEPSPGLVRVEVDATVATLAMRLAGVEALSVKAAAEAKGPAPTHTRFALSAKGGAAHP